LTQTYQHKIADAVSGATTWTQPVGTNKKSAAKYSATVFWTGTLTGTFKIQVSNNSTTGADGTWVDYTITLSTQPAGSAGNFGASLSNCGYYWVRWVYTAVSGTGTFTIDVTGTP
jgi:hypothetical protein